MDVYDIFLKNKHPRVVSELMIRNNQTLLEYLLSLFPHKKRKYMVLEVGPGKGYLKEAIYRKNKTREETIDYYASDRNENILKNLCLDQDHVILSDLPDLKSRVRFDIIFVGYVIEHLADGVELYHALSSLKAMLKDDGILVLLFPDCMRLGMEFYNIDYTHTLATTKRNVNQAVMDCGMHVRKAIDICGILYPRKVDSRASYMVRSLVMKFYNYRFWCSVSRLVYRIPVWDLRNVFWKAYGLLKEPNVLFIVGK